MVPLQVIVIMMNMLNETVLMNVCSVMRVLKCFEIFWVDICRQNDNGEYMS